MTDFDTLRRTLEDVLPGVLPLPELRNAILGSHVGGTSTANAESPAREQVPLEWRSWMQATCVLDDILTDECEQNQAFLRSLSVILTNDEVEAAVELAHKYQGSFLTEEALDGVPFLEQNVRADAEIEALSRFSEVLAARRDALRQRLDDMKRELAQYHAYGTTDHRRQLESAADTTPQRRVL